MLRRTLQTLDRYRRVVATGTAFALFGMGALVISVTWFPMIRLRARDDAQTRERVRAALKRLFGLFVATLRAFGLMTLEIRGLEKLNVQGTLVLANHPTLIDVVVLLSLMPQADCIVKQQLWRNPFLRWPVRWADYIPNTDPEALLNECVARLKSGRSLLVFPEGTRSEPDTPPAFKRGAAQIALAAGCPVLPIRISCEPPTLRKREPWYRVPKIRPHFTVTIGEPLPPASYVSGEPPSVAARRVTRIFESVLISHGPG